jgi:cyanate permease
MPDFKRTARIAGCLFLLALLANLVGSELLDSIVIAPDYLRETYPHKTSVIVGMLMEILSAAAVVGIAVVLYPVLKFYNRTIALAYLGFRLIEPAITIVIILASLSILTLSQQYILAGAGDVADYALLGTLFQATRDWALMIYIMIFCTGAVLFYGLLYRTRLVPRLLSVWGLVGAAILFGGAIVDMLFYDIPVEAYGAVMGLNEVFFPIWLIVKGFNQVERTGVAAPMSPA